MSSHPLSHAAFREIARIFHEASGIRLKDAKRSMVISRLGHRARALGLPSLDAYVALVKEHPARHEERVELVNALTTNKTEFFREPHHFNLLGQILPELVRRRRQTVRIWSCACSTGEEPYSIAIVAHKSVSGLRHASVRILATDLDTNALRVASRGIYPRELIAPVPSDLRHRGFVAKPNLGGRDCVQVTSEIRAMVLFRQVNLMRDAFRFSRPVDIVFCRNVLIYFDTDARREIVDKLHAILRPDGHIFVGHAESLLGQTERFRFVCSTVYQRI